MVLQQYIPLLQYNALVDGMDGLTDSMWSIDIPRIDCNRTTLKTLWQKKNEQISTFPPFFLTLHEFIEIFHNFACILFFICLLNGSEQLKSMQLFTPSRWYGIGLIQYIFLSRYKYKVWNQYHFSYQLQYETSCWKRHKNSKQIKTKTSNTCTKYCATN